MDTHPMIDGGHNLSIIMEYYHLWPKANTDPKGSWCLLAALNHNPDYFASSCLYDQVDVHD